MTLYSEMESFLTALAFTVMMLTPILLGLLAMKYGDD